MVDAIGMVQFLETIFGTPHSHNSQKGKNEGKKHHFATK